MTVTQQGRLDVELVRRGLARSRTRAAALVQGGLVTVGGAVVRRPAHAVTDGDDVRVLADDPYVSRGALKLDHALDALHRLLPGRPAVVGAHCLDAGASTGGFTQVLLRRGAAHVEAVDVGHGQLADVVRHDPRVTVREGVNVRDLTASSLTAAPSVVVADLSFISLGLVVPALVGVTARPGDLLLLVKPQFEVGRDRLGRGGVVTSPQLRVGAVEGVAAACVAAGAVVRAVLPSGLPGEAGNHEYVLWATVGREESSVGAPLHEAVGRAVHDGTPTLVGEVAG